jgi:hypothetical protein
MLSGSAILKDSAGLYIDTFNIASGSFTISDASTYVTGSYHIYNINTFSNLHSVESAQVISKPLTQAETILEAVNNILLNRATSAEKALSYKDKALEYYSIKELIALKQHLISEINATANGGETPSIQFQFGEH